ncbi:hypothetical protein SH139x_005123 [Planctomycetaceae bacterium SH139]
MIHHPTISRLLHLIVLTLLMGQLPVSGQEYPLRWWKGNLHTHTFWSDGNDFPEMSADWYQQRGYNFLALTDHNVLSQGMRWMEVRKVIDRGGDEVMEKYLQRFGSEWVETRGETDSPDFAVRLKPFDEYRYLLERQGEFILIPAEEISDRAEGKPVHMNATNLAEVIQPVGGETVREAIANNFRAVDEQAKRLGREILLHLNHPNFGWAVRPEDLALVTEERFFEVYNGHPGVNHLGDKTRPSVEDFWDLANSLRLTVLNVEPLFGIATDDTHHYHGKGGSRPGRGWVMVRSRFLTPEHLIRAIKRGDFYSSSGVTLLDTQYDEAAKRLRVEVDVVEGETYTIQFIGSLQQPTPETPDRELIGKVLKTQQGTSGTYQLTGEELYVRAVVTSSAAAVDPSFSDQKKQAWTQPVGWEASFRK